MKDMSKESQMVDYLFEIDRKMKAKQEQIAGYVYVVFSEWKHPVCVNYGDWSTQYECEKEIIVIVDNEDKAKTIVKENMESFGQDENVSYYYEKWEVMHYE